MPEKKETKKTEYIVNPKADFKKHPSSEASTKVLIRVPQRIKGYLKKLGDWRAMVDRVMIDSAYEGKVVNITLIDAPEKKNDLLWEGISLKPRRARRLRLG